MGHLVRIESDSAHEIHTILLLDAQSLEGADVLLAGLGVCGPEAAFLKAHKCASVEARIDLTQPFDARAHPWPPTGTVSGSGITIVHQDRAPGPCSCDVCSSYGDSTCARPPPDPKSATASDFDCVTLEDRTRALARCGCSAIDTRWLVARRVVIEVEAIEPLCCIAQPLRMLPLRQGGTPIEVRIKGERAIALRLRTMLPSHLLVVAD